jgi:hypothetical protein
MNSLVLISEGSRSNRPQVKSASCQINPKSNQPQVKSAPCYIYKIKWKYRYLTLFFLPNATCLLEKQKYQFLQSLVWHIISYWKMILCLFLVAKACVPSVILSSWSVVLSGQIDVPYVYKPLAMMNFRECFKVNF